MERVALVIAPHPDDAEIAMGGTIAALTAQGVRVNILDLTDGEPTPFGSTEIRAQETVDASRILGVSWRRNLGLKNREIFDSVENRSMLANIIREVKPALLFSPFWEDAHPDHVEASKLTDSARFYSKFVKSALLHEPWFPRKQIYFFSTHLKVRFSPSFVFDVSAYLDTKLAALHAYRSQFHAHNTGRIEEIGREARYWGDQIGTVAGEPFMLRESLKLNTLEALFSV